MLIFFFLWQPNQLIQTLHTSHAYHPDSGDNSYRGEV